MNRREFLSIAAASAALTLPDPVRAMRLRGGNALVVYDSRFDEARLFAKAAAEEHNLQTFGFAGDATALWHDQLFSALRDGTFVIGLTAGGARFCMQLMAGPGMRITHHVTHATLGSGLPHACWTGDYGVDLELSCAPAWPEQAARIAIRQSVEAPDRRGCQTVSREYPAHLLPAADHLESWVLAPAPAAIRSGSRPVLERNS